MISKGNYLTILTLIFIIFIAFMFEGVFSNVLPDVYTNNRVKGDINIKYGDIITSSILNQDVEASAPSETGREVFGFEEKLRVAILSKDKNNTASQVCTEWCTYNKYLYKHYDNLPTSKEMSEYDVMLFGDYNITSRDIEILYAYADLGISMIFTQLPDYHEIIMDKELAAFFGIEKGVMESVIADGFKIFPGFMINKERVYKEGDYFGEKDDTKIEVPYYNLAPGYEVYAVGLLDNQKELGIKDKDLPPLLWRTFIKNSFIFVINSDIFEGTSTLGVLTGFMAHQGECFLYPIVNAMTVSLIDYPYFSNENNQVIQKLYSRDSESLARDLLWPNVIQILKNYGSSYNFFVASQLDYSDGIGSKDSNLDFYLREIGKLSGKMGISLGQMFGTGLRDIIQENKGFFTEHIPNYKFSALYAKNISNELKGMLDEDFLENISLVMSDYKKGNNLIDFLDDSILSVKFNLDGYEHETMDDIRMVCVANALGMCNMKVDMGRVIYPESSSDEWHRLSLKWSKGDTYFNDFTMFDMVSIHELEDRIRRFLAVDYFYEHNHNRIDIYIDHFEKEAYFILITNNEIVDFVKNGTYEKISDYMYLIKATDAKVGVYTIEDNFLDKPKNNKLVPSTPERLLESDI